MTLVKADYFENLIQESIISGVKRKKYISLDEFPVYNANVDQEKLREHFCDGRSIEDIQQALPKNTQTLKSCNQFVHLWELDEISFKEPEDQIYEDFAQSQIKSLKNLTQKLEDAYFTTHRFCKARICWRLQGVANCSHSIPNQ